LTEKNKIGSVGRRQKKTSEGSPFHKGGNCTWKRSTGSRRWLSESFQLKKKNKHGEVSSKGQVIRMARYSMKEMVSRKRSKPNGKKDEGSEVLREGSIEGGKGKD